MAEFLASSSSGVQRTGEAAYSFQASLSREAYHALCRLRREEEPESEIVEKALILLDTYSVVSRALGHQSFKAITVVQQMRAAGYPDDWAVTLCRALFRQKERDLRKAFRLFDQNKSGWIEAQELREALPLMGEEVPEERIDELFALVDVDKDGYLTFEEFCTLVQGLNEEDSDHPDAFAAFRSSAAGAVGSATEALSAVQTAWSADLKGLSPFELRKAGVVLTRMTEKGYSEAKALAVCRALFCGQTEKQLKKAYQFFDADANGQIDCTELREAMLLMGEGLSDADVSELFKALDHDGDGGISFEEFCVLLKAVKEKGEEPTGSVLSAVTSTWEKLSASFTG